MEKKEMTKKHLITCSVMLVLVIVSGLNIYSKEVEKNKKTSNVAPVGVPKVLLKSADQNDDFTFANEALPVNNAVVKRKLQHSLLMHHYRNIHSDILHNKAEKIFPIIEPILKAYGIPDDFKYIPLVEAGFSEGTSSKGAKGLWQFMPGTARTYGLKVGNGIDERTNLCKATKAACRYIKELYAQFNSWTLAAAAYNNGEIKLAKAMNRQNEDNYFRMHLNRETGVYVYDLIAMKAIISQPWKYGYNNHVKLAPIDLMAFN
jgi:hypothetical protein